MNSKLYISSDTKMSGNTASNNAPGIYNQSSQLFVEGLLTLEDGIYISDRNSVVKIQNELTESAKIQINQSTYVMPDASLSPIVIAESTDTHPTLTVRDLQAFIKPVQNFERWAVELNTDQTQIVLVYYELEEYTIAYQNLQGATHTNPTTYTIETPTIMLTNPSSLRCKQFLGWFDENNRIRREITQGTSGNIVLTARWDNIGCCKIGYICSPRRWK